jgi:phosphoesterase RecJ-like protein
MINRIIELIHRCNTFLITAHVRLDGDALGSELALWHVLRALGKGAVVYNQDGTPDMYAFLPGTEVIVHTLDDVAAFDAAFILDCSDLERVGDDAGRIRSVKEIVNIDHHISNTFFSEISFVDAEASSTGEILHRIIERLGVPVTPEIATNLYTAILTDTGAFRYSNTKSSTLRVAADLVEAGADPRGVAEKIYETKPLAQIRLLKDALDTLELHDEGTIGFVVVTQKMLETTGALPEYTEGIVDLARSVKGIEVAAFFQEMAARYYKISLRSKGNVNVEKVARKFGGGGHINAAACRIDGEIDDVKNELLRTIEAAEA